MGLGNLSSVAGMTVWNSLPDSLRDPADESERLRRDFKTHLFRDMSALEVSSFHGIAIHKSTFAYLLCPRLVGGTVQMNDE